MCPFGWSTGSDLISDDRQGLSRARLKWSRLVGINYCAEYRVSTVVVLLFELGTFLTKLRCNQARPTRLDKKELLTCCVRYALLIHVKKDKEISSCEVANTTREHSSWMRSARLYRPYVLLQQPPDVSSRGGGPQVKEFDRSLVLTTTYH